VTLLLVGIVIFFGVHALTMARGLRLQLIGQLGEGGYKGAYSVLSFLGFGLIIWGFVQYRAGGYIPIWSPPPFMNHIAMALMLPAMLLLFVYLLPAGRMKVAVKHPMLTMIKVWALAHLLANGDLGSLLLFGSFLIYAVVDRIAVKRHGGDVPRPLPWNSYDTAAIVLGIVGYLAVVYWLHPILFGVPVLPRLA
jgi:uncharacterized membrane protein